MEKKKRGSRKRQSTTEEAIGLKKPGGWLMVGIGASAGGIKPLLEMFSRIPADSGMAYVVILHLSPTHESSLAELLQKATTIPVSQVQDTVKVKPNRIYVIPPNKNLMLEDGTIQLAEPQHIRGQRVPIDHFFRSLAEVYRNNAIAVVLSGAGADGTLGMQCIKEQGGLTIVQDPREAEQESMPRNAINAGTVDFVLPVAEIPNKLMSLFENARQIVLPATDEEAQRDKISKALREVLNLVLTRTGHDFSDYKPSTILRRIERRLQVNEVKDIPSYLIFMREHQEEVHALLRDLLISVTNFFRDHDAFEHLERVIIPRLFADKNGKDQVRVWVTGCATGEEAYSIAILLSEYAAGLSNPPKLQIFATDIDEDALNRARKAVYPDTIADDVSPERLKRFFVNEGGHYRIRTDVRETVLFTPHNILRDPPFSKIDLVTCRNLLIYLTREIHERVLEIFHFALRPDGVLFLGSSESAEGTPALFKPLDKTYRSYQRLAANNLPHSFPTLPQSGRWSAKAPHLPSSAQPPRAFSFAELHQQTLLERHTPPSVLVNTDYDILHISGDAGRYLRFSAGEPSRNLLKVVPESLRLELRVALFAARREGSRSEAGYIHTQVDGDSILLHLIVEPVAGPQGFLMVVFDEVKEAATPLSEDSPAPTNASDSGMEPVVRQMEDELQRARDQLRANIEQYETAVEELRASNEELQAMNEELLSVSEEMESGKEELQSVNEELTTVNYELKEKVDELSHANSDLQNLMASTDIGTVFLDRILHIKRYTPQVKEIFNIIGSDINRPLDHLKHNLDYDGLTEDAKQVMATLQPIERVVKSGKGHWYIARLLPYRTLDDRLDGVVLTFVDITERKRAVEGGERLDRELERQRTLLEAVMRQMPVGIIIAGAPEGRLILGNEQGERIWQHAFIASNNVAGYASYKGFFAGGRPYQPEEWPLARSLQQGEVVADEEVEFLRGDDTRGWTSVSSAPIYDAEGQIMAAVMVFLDITEHRRAVLELENVRASLEMHVAERTAALEESNTALSEEIDERRRVEDERTQIMRQMVTALEEERRRISRELHDQLGQRLTVLKLHLELLLAQSGFAALREQIEEAQAMVQAIDKDLDFLAWQLRPTALDDLGLAAVLANFVQEWSAHFNLRAEFHASRLNQERLSGDTETMLYRITQEALNNVSKHAQADHVEVMLERHGEQIVLIIEDNGTGFDVNQATAVDTRRGMGLINMRERAAFVGGTFEIESQPGQGTTIYVRVPFVQESDQG